MGAIIQISLSAGTWLGGEKLICKSVKEITGNSELCLRELTDLDYEVVRVKWQQETKITNSYPYLLGVCWDIDTNSLTCVRAQ